MRQEHSQAGRPQEERQRARELRSRLHFVIQPVFFILSCRVCCMPQGSK